MCAYLNQEYDRLGDHTKSQLLADFLELIERPAKTLAETKKILIEFVRNMNNIRDELGKEVDINLKTSMCISIIVSASKREF